VPRSPAPSRRFGRAGPRAREVRLAVSKLEISPRRKIVHVYLSTAGSMASHGRPDVYMDTADLRAQNRGGPDVHEDDDFKEHYDEATGLIGVILSLLDRLTYAPGQTPSASAPARDLRRKRNERENQDGSLQPFPLLKTGANFIAEDLVPPDYRVRTS
jgi:hypothetical protein